MSIEARFSHRFSDAFTLDVALTLPARGISVLFGPSGCGKTTLLRCLAGLQRAQQGQLVVNGECWHDQHTFLPTHRRPIGFVFQDTQLFPHLTVQGNLDYGMKRADASASRRTLDDAVALLGIGALLPRRPDSLSGGERQRVAIARALALAPRLLLMDEPLAALDARRKQEILPFLDRLHRELTMPLVYVTHAMAEVMRLADHVVALDDGRVAAAGPLHQMLARLDVPQLAQDEGAGIVLPCAVAERDTTWQLTRLAFDGGSIWTRDIGHAVGETVRVQVLARDVSLSRSELVDSSINNQWPGTLETLADDVHPAHQLALVRVGGVLVMSRLTRRSAHRLQLAPGLAVWVQVKAVAVVA